MTVEDRAAAAGAVRVGLALGLGRLAAVRDVGEAAGVRRVRGAEQALAAVRVRLAGRRDARAQRAATVADLVRAAVRVARAAVAARARARRPREIRREARAVRVR